MSLTAVFLLAGAVIGVAVFAGSSLGFLHNKINRTERNLREHIKCQERATEQIWRTISDIRTEPKPGPGHLVWNGTEWVAPKEPSMIEVMQENMRRELARENQRVCPCGRHTDPRTHMPEPIVIHDEKLRCPSCDHGVDVHAGFGCQRVIDVSRLGQPDTCVCLLPYGDYPQETS